MIFTFLSHINFFRFNPAKLSTLMFRQKSKLLLISFSIITAFVFSSCDKIPSGVVDSQIVDYAVTKIVSPTSVLFTPSDSSVVTSVQFSNYGSIGNVWCKISLLDGTVIIKDNNTMTDDGKDGDAKAGDGIYTSKFLMSKNNPSGIYQIEYFVTDNINLPPNNFAKVGSALFTYGNNQNNLPPVISDVGLPASVNRGDSFLISVKASDPNGLSDLYQVYFKLYRPDGSMVDPGNGLGYFIMFDDGSHGDQTAGDGTYSLQNYFGQTSQTGSWKFEFQAKDYGGKLSNVLTQNLTVN